jgi:hypothetical protein
LFLIDKLFGDHLLKIIFADLRTAGENVGTYAINIGSLNASGNYTINFTGRNFIIYPAVLTITANDFSKTYDGVAYSGGNGVNYYWFVNRETASVLNGTLQYGGTAQGTIDEGISRLFLRD